MRVLIGVSTIRDAHKPIWQVATYNNLERPPGTDFRLSTSYEGIAGNRNAIAKCALEEEYSHVLFLDDDIGFPVDGLTQMLRWQYPVVAGVYRLRVNCVSVGNFVGGFAWSPIAWPRDNPAEYCSMAAGGCLLVDARILRQLSQPWWEFHPDHSEDVHFAHKLVTELGIPILADLRVQCGHGTPMWMEPDGRVSWSGQPRKVVAGE